MIILLSFCLVVVFGDGQFECGDHGRFEYCIDEIPGCVIGCHCHPGYYFDTESKICEPNIKLTQNYRKYMQPHEPYLAPTESSPKAIEITEAVITQDPVDYQVDEITKNADDLGDWLYNQFFKTIESQVINNTKENKVPNRRSGSGPIIKNISRRRASRKKSKQSKQRKSKSSMRRKLLRITENDSVFDSSSESRSDSSDSSSDDSGTSFEIERNDEKHTDDREHGHKKIVIINKKQKPPLPSFIFLPNMDTPFYPPIGLPPPPIMPLYPIVPIPPMPAFPWPDKDETGSTTSASTTTTAHISTSLTTSSTTLETLSPSTIEENIETTTISSTTIPAELRNLYRGGRSKKKNRGKILHQRNNYNDYKRDRLQEQREKLLQRIRQKSRNPIFKHPVQDDDNIEIPFIEDNGFEGTLNNEIQSSPIQNSKLKPENVDFKYISELIHRAKINDTRNLINRDSFHPVDNHEVYKPALNKVKQQVSNIPKETTRRDDSEDSYYTNLGRQIASIIRSADAQNQQVNIEIEHTNQNQENHVFFNDNSPKSFWERSVRSPVTFLNANKNKFDYLKKSNQLLFDIENKVSIAASTEPSLSLHEIENMINVVEKAQRLVKSHKINQFDVNDVKESSRNLNIKLWPKDNEHTKSDINFHVAPEAIVTQNNNVRKTPNMHGVSMHNFHRFTAWFSSGKTNLTQNNKLYTLDTRTPAYNTKYPIMSQAQLSPLRLPPPSIHTLNTAPNLNHPLLNQYHYYSAVPNNKYNLERKKYFQDISNEQTDDGSVLPMKRVIHQLANKAIVQQPSYFHHGVNHFDYI